MLGEEDRGPRLCAEIGPSPEPLELLPLLKRVSRAFYLSIRVLPERIRQPAGLAYLLARAADTIADTEAVSPDERLSMLLAFRKMLVSGEYESEQISLLQSMTDHQPTAAEHDLLSAIPGALFSLGKLLSEDRDLVTSIVVKLTEGMEFDLTRFPPGGSRGIRSLADSRELDKYTYLVAGCVGEFWTRITVSHTPELSAWDIDRMCAIGVRFGHALQMTNVLRDIPADLSSGRCYLPADWLNELGLAPHDLSDPRVGLAARPVMARGVELALEHFAEAERYVAAIPSSCVRLRLAAIWPLLMGLATLEKVARNPYWLNPNVRVKVSRVWVFRMIVVSLLVGRSNGLVSWWIRRLTQRVRSEVKRP